LRQPRLGYSFETIDLTRQVVVLLARNIEYYPQDDSQQETKIRQQPGELIPVPRLLKDDRKGSQACVVDGVYEHCVYGDKQADRRGEHLEWVEVVFDSEVLDYNLLLFPLSMKCQFPVLLCKG
jgi:hypothetical protein